MLVVFPFSTSDQDLALKNAQWMNELGGCKGHSVLVVHDCRCNPITVDAIRVELTKAFDHIYRVDAPAKIDGWPQGANYFFRSATTWLQNKPEWPYFFWMEPDAIMTREGALDAIQAEFERVAKPSGKFFMGDRVQVNGIPLHMSGIGIYHNPIHRYAGECFRAFDVAFDMVSKDQIVPRAHFTKLIEHAWKHPSFTNEHELETQIRPEAVIFHSSKDGSLIDLLQSKRRGGSVVPATSPKISVVESRIGNDRVGSCIAQNSSTTDFSCDIFIRTYPGDYQWLEYCLKSIEKFCSGFRKVWIISPANPPDWMTERTKHPQKIEMQWRIENEECEDHYLSQQIHKLYADVITDYQADYILHIDSDTVFNRHATPMDFMDSNKVAWPYTPYSKIQTPWQPITEKFMGCKIENEFMRRFPIMVPRWLYPRLREFCHRSHGMIISEYIKIQPIRSFSEFNALGAYAWTYHRDKFAWLNTEEVELQEPFARQFFSHGGITPEVQSEINRIFSTPDGSSTEPDSLGVVSFPENDGGNIASGGEKIPVQATGSASSTLRGDGAETTLTQQGGDASLPEIPTPSTLRVNNAAPTVQSAGAAIPKGIKELKSGIWVIEDDTHISKWVEQQGRVDHDMNLLPFIIPEINEGDTVVDAGAFIGDHTVAYLRAVGKTGSVHAFEPNPLAYQCLLHNVGITDYNGNYYGKDYCLSTYQLALGDVDTQMSLNATENNYGGFYIGPANGDRINVARLDFFHLKPNFIKLDVEGYEIHALEGMRNTIREFKPKLVIEINFDALKRQGSYPGQIFSFLENHGYNWRILQENCGKTSPMYDILATPKLSPKVTTPAFRQASPEPSPGFTPAPSVTLYNYKDVIKSLRDFADQSKGNRIRVGMQLTRAKLK